MNRLWIARVLVSCLTAIVPCAAAFEDRETAESPPEGAD